MMMINEWTGYNHIEFTHTSHNLVVGARLLPLLLPINTGSVPRQYLLFMRFYFYFVNFTAHGYRLPTTERERERKRTTNLRETRNLYDWRSFQRQKVYFSFLLLFSTSFAVSPAIVCIGLLLSFMSNGWRCICVQAFHSIFVVIFTLCHCNDIVEVVCDIDDPVRQHI